jgi:hypothetical protein
VAVLFSATQVAASILPARPLVAWEVRRLQLPLMRKRGEAV